MVSLIPFVNHGHLHQISILVSFLSLYRLDTISYMNLFLRNQFMGSMCQSLYSSNVLKNFLLSCYRFMFYTLCKFIFIYAKLLFKMYPYINNKFYFSDCICFVFGAGDCAYLIFRTSRVQRHLPLHN